MPFLLCIRRAVCSFFGVILYILQVQLLITFHGFLHRLKKKVLQVGTGTNESSQNPGSNTGLNAYYRSGT